MRSVTPEQLRAAAAQLREDAADGWGVRRKLNLRAAALLLERAARELELEQQRKETTR